MKPALLFSIFSVTPTYTNNPLYYSYTTYENNKLPVTISNNFYYMVVWEITVEFFIATNVMQAWDC